MMVRAKRGALQLYKVGVSEQQKTGGLWVGSEYRVALVMLKAMAKIAPASFGS